MDVWDMNGIRLIRADEIVGKIEELSKSISDASEMYKIVLQEIDCLQKEETDLNHRLERKECKYTERARIATVHQRLLQRRRELKDWSRTMENMLEYLTTQQGIVYKTEQAKFLGIARKCAETEKRKEVAAIEYKKKMEG